jgi:hypothetical protein
MKSDVTEMGSKLSVVAILLAGLLSAGCASLISGPGTSRSADYTIKINFDANGCPISVAPDSTFACSKPVPPQGICVERTKSVQWYSDPVGTKFEVFFDPFVGHRYKSTGVDEKTAPIVVKRDAIPEATYEYGVFGVDCTVGDPVLDPAFRVER